LIGGLAYVLGLRALGGVPSLHPVPPSRAADPNDVAPTEAST